MAFFKLERWGYDVENERAGKIAAAVINSSQRAPTRGVHWTDFFPPVKLEALEPEQTQEEQIALLKAVNNNG